MKHIGEEERLPRWWVWLLVIGATGIGTFLRFYHLAVPSIWIDELNHYYAAQSLLETGHATFPSGQANDRALLYSALVSCSFKILGTNEFSLRVPSALLGVLCILMTFLVAKRWFGPTTATLAALFLAISPFAIGWSRLSRMYTLFQLLFMLGIYAFFRGFEGGSLDRFARWQGKLFSGSGDSRISALLNRWNLNVFWLALSFTFLLLSFWVHELTALFCLGLLLYLLVMFVVQCREQGLIGALKGKYFISLTFIISLLIFAIAAVAPIRSTVSYALTYIPQWAEGTRFQDRKLYLDFIFDQYNFPMGTLFIVGVYQVITRIHRPGLYSLGIFTAYLFMFTFVFRYRHFQYLYNVYPLLVMISAFAFSNIATAEFGFIKKHWLSKSNPKTSLVKAVALGCFLAWIPFTPSVRLARRIPFSGDGSFNGAMFMEEWREACNFVREHLAQEDVVISTDALGTLHYLGRVDFDLNFADLDLSMEKKLENAQGRYFDLYSGRPFIERFSQLDTLTAANKTIWLLVQRYKFLEAQVFVPTSIRDYVLTNFQRVLTTKNGTVLVFRSPRETS